MSVEFLVGGMRIRQADTDARHKTTDGKQRTDDRRQRTGRITDIEYPTSNDEVNSTGRRRRPRRTQRRF